MVCTIYLDLHLNLQFSRNPFISFADRLDVLIFSICQLPRLHKYRR